MLQLIREEIAILDEMMMSLTDIRVIGQCIDTRDNLETDLGYYSQLLRQQSN